MYDVFKQALKAVWIILTGVGFRDCYTVTMFYQRGHLRQKYAFPRLNLQNCFISPTAIKSYKLCRFSKIVSRAVATRALQTVSLMNFARSPFSKNISAGCGLEGRARFQTFSFKWGVPSI